MKRINNEKGSALMIAMVMLFLLTMIGMSGLMSASTEMKIAANDIAYKQNFYVAESAIYEGIRKMEKQKMDNPAVFTADRTSIPWFNIEDDGFNFGNSSEWDYDELNNNDNSEQSVINGNAYYALEDHGIVRLASLDMAEETLVHHISIYGYYREPGKGEVLVEAGYITRY